MKLDRNKFLVSKFGFFSSEDPFDIAFSHDGGWSRIYEYDFVLGEVASCGIVAPKIHNAAWGCDEAGVVFKTHLDVRHAGVLHTDARRSSLIGAAVWDICFPPSEALCGRFDVVLNVSAIGKARADHRAVIEHHLRQLKADGIFVCTFEYPGFQLSEIENYLGEKSIVPAGRLSPRNSRLPNGAEKFPDETSVGYLVIRRV